MASFFLSFSTQDYPSNVYVVTHIPLLKHRQSNFTLGRRGTCTSFTFRFTINYARQRNLSENCSKRKRTGDGDGKTPPKKQLTRFQKAKKAFTAAQRAAFKAKYKELHCLGAGGCGSVFNGYNKATRLPVAIKHVIKEKVLCKAKTRNGKKLSSEVVVMTKISSKKKSSAPVALLDWYDLDSEIILVLERPEPCKNLDEYCMDHGGSLAEEQAKNILKQLVDAAKDLEKSNIFHRDLKQQNILIETGSSVPRVRLIDFGMSCFFNKRSSYNIFFGTADHMPPECVSGCHKPGPTTVWQIGVVLFETLQGEGFETKRFFQKECPIRKDLSQDCLKFLKLCLSKKPEDRPTLAQLQLHQWLQ